MNAALAPITLQELSGLDRAPFAARLAGLFEGSPWVAEAAWPERPWSTLAELHGSLVAAMSAASEARKRALLRAHPDLSGRAVRAAGLTAESRAEQAAAGLDELDAEGAATLVALNRDYRERFGFPLIVCAREHTPATILVWGAERLGRETADEQTTALGEVAKIARLRLEDLLG